MEKTVFFDPIQQKLAAIRNRIDQVYTDKVDRKISEEFWQRKTTEWQMEEQQVLMAMQGLEQASPDRLLSAKKTLELANQACFQYLTQNPLEQGRLLKKVLLNCRVDGVSLYPTYRKPFDLILNRAKKSEWSGREDLNLPPSVPKPGALDIRRSNFNNLPRNVAVAAQLWHYAKDQRRDQERLC
jgi:hypothetical protein